MTLLTVTGGGSADEEHRRCTDEEAAEKASSAKAVRATAALQTTMSVPETCDLYRDNWVYDEVNASVYKEGECKFLTKQVTQQSALPTWCSMKCARTMNKEREKV